MKRSSFAIYAIISSTIIVFLVTIEMLSIGITSVFPHLFYIPILLIAYYYPKQSLFIAPGICFLYFIPVMYFYPFEPLIILSAFIRAFMFLVVALIVSCLILKENTEREENDRLLEFQNKIIENPQVMVIITDKKGNIIIWNKGAENISGYSKSEVIGRSDIWEQVVPESEVEKFNLIQKEIESNQISAEGISIPLVTKGGDLRHLILSIQAMNAKNEEISAIICIAVDVTEKRRLESENKAALAQIEKNISKMYILNDEIRNPLAIILGQVELNQQSSRQIICEQVIHINDIISQLDRDSIESTKILEFLRRHYCFFNDDDEK